MTSKRNPESRGSTPATPAGRRAEILVVDDHPFMRSGLSQLIDRQTDMRVCGEAGSPAEVMPQLAKALPDLILSDMTMPGRGGLEFIKDIVATHPTAKILILSMHDELIYAERVLRAGARGYIMKETGGEKLLLAIRKVLQGEVYLSPEMSARVLDNISGRRPRGSSSPIAKLTDREFEIFQLIGRGLSTQKIADDLHLSSKTVDVHRSNIREKLELQDSTALVRYAVRWIESGGAE